MKIDLEVVCEIKTVETHHVVPKVFLNGRLIAALPEKSFESRDEAETALKNWQDAMDRRADCEDLLRTLHSYM